MAAATAGAATAVEATAAAGSAAAETEAGGGGGGGGDGAAVERAALPDATPQANPPLRNLAAENVCIAGFRLFVVGARDALSRLKPT